MDRARRSIPGHLLFDAVRVFFNSFFNRIFCDLIMTFSAGNRMTFPCQIDWSGLEPRLLASLPYEHQRKSSIDDELATRALKSIQAKMNGPLNAPFFIYNNVPWTIRAHKEVKLNSLLAIQVEKIFMLILWSFQLFSTSREFNQILKFVTLDCFYFHFKRCWRIAASRLRTPLVVTTKLCSSWICFKNPTQPNDGTFATPVRPLPHFRQSQEK